MTTKLQLIYALDGPGSESIDVYVDTFGNDWIVHNDDVINTIWAILNNKYKLIEIVNDEGRTEKLAYVYKNRQKNAGYFVSQSDLNHAAQIAVDKWLEQNQHADQDNKPKRQIRG